MTVRAAPSACPPSQTARSAASPHAAFSTIGGSAPRRIHSAEVCCAGGRNEADFDRRRGKRGRPPDSPPRHGRGGQGRPACAVGPHEASLATDVDTAQRAPGHEHGALRVFLVEGRPSVVARQTMRKDLGEERRRLGVPARRAVRGGCDERVVRQDGEAGALRGQDFIHSDARVHKPIRAQRVDDNGARRETGGQQDRCCYQRLDERETHGPGDAAQAHRTHPPSCMTTRWSPPTVKDPARGLVAPGRLGRPVRPNSTMPPG